jgi:2-polyprenyl-3-methyl-5-hydroxy-6-metoxy-1,4-benzoquinol methylase
LTRQAGYESREYDRLVERDFKPYSRGHQVMYLQSIADILAERGERNTRVLEAGFGIGWGLDKMVEANILRSYVGYEPNKDSFNYVRGRYPITNSLALLLNLPFEPNLDPAFDVAFCIEVIEHVAMADHVEFLKGLHRMAPRLYLSTPDKDKVPREGVRTKDDWVMRLMEAGFTKVDVMTKEWTYLYRCTR